MTFISIQEALQDSQDGKAVALRGWIHRKRDSKKMIFLVLRDSSNIIQCVVKNEDEKLFEEGLKVTIESSVELEGTIHKDERAPTGYELRVTKLHIVGLAETFPIGKDQSEEFLMDVRHLWIRSRKLNHVFKIRHTAFGAFHEYFRSKKFYEIQSPIFTKNACEGGTSLFEVKYFDEPMYLSQSWQLYAEAMIQSLENIYCLEPSFRAERSKTNKHLTEYWHGEAEMAWMNIDQGVEIAEGMIAHLCKTVAEKNAHELKELGQDPGELLKITAPFPRITYAEAREILKKDSMDLADGADIRTLEEAQLMTHYDKPVFVTHFPRKVRGFYQKRSEEDPEIVLGFDCIAPRVGELIGGSERENDIGVLEKAIKEEGGNLEDYEWYFDTRKYGAVPHTGFGFGMERFIQWICGLDHIRDTIPFPRTLNRVRP